MNIATRDEKVIGIVGGMGPHAGAALYNNILNLTNAYNDQEHLSVVLMSFPSQIVDRTSYLEDREQINPGIGISNIIEKLEYAGAEVIGIACNTSYAPPIFEVIERSLTDRKSRVKVLNMPFETCNYIKVNFPHVKRVGVMATNGTYKSKIYHKNLTDLGIEVITPDWYFQNEIIHNLIYNPEFGIKRQPSPISEKARELFDIAINYFLTLKADAVIYGCTDLSLLSAETYLLDMLMVDSTKVFALSLIKEVREPQSGPVALIDISPAENCG